MYGSLVECKLRICGKNITVHDTFKGNAVDLTINSINDYSIVYS